MGKISKKNAKTIGTVPQQFTGPRSKNKRTRRRLSRKKSFTEIIYPSKPNHIAETPNNNTNNDLINYANTVISSIKHNNSQTTSKVLNSDDQNISIIDITDSTFDENEDENSQPTSSKVLTSNTDNDSIIDITNDENEFKNNQSTSRQVTILDNESDIIDITNITIQENVHKDLQTVSSTVTTVSDDLQMINNTCATNKPIELITISDSSDEENAPNQHIIKKNNVFKSINNHLGISTQSINIKKKKYNSPLHQRKSSKIAENLSRHNFLLDDWGPFIIDKQRITDNHSQHFKNFESKPFLPPQQHKVTSVAPSGTNRKLRPIIIDGLNIGHAHGGSGIFSVKGIDLCVKFFTNRGHKDVVAFIPQHRQGPPGSESNTLLNQLVKRGHICFTPSRKVQNLRMTCHDDRIILDYAHRCNGVVVSNDNYRDLYNENDAFKDIIENRQVMVTFVRDEIIVPEDQYNRRSDIRSLSDILCFPD